MCSHARDLFEVGGHLTLRDFTGTIGVVLGKGLFECLPSKVGFLAHAPERVQHKIESFILIKETIVVSVVVGPHGLNCLLDHHLSLRETVIHTQWVWLYIKQNIKAIDCSVSNSNTYLFVDGFFDGVDADGWRAHWEEGHILVLHTISHVQLTPLALPEVGNGAGPDGGLDYDNVVLFHSVLRIAHRVGHCVTVGAQDPRGVVALAGTILSDWLKTKLVRIRAEDCIDGGFSVIDVFCDCMTSLVVLEDIPGVVDPALFLAHLSRGGHRNGLFGVLGLVWLNIEGQLAFLFTFGDFMAANWYKFGSVVNPGNLGA